MGQALEEQKKENIDKIKIGLCLEVLYINDFIDDQLHRIKRIIDENSALFDGEYKFILEKNLDDISSLLGSNYDFILHGIDKDMNFREYDFRYY